MDGYKTALLNEIISLQDYKEKLWKKVLDTEYSEHENIRKLNIKIDCVASQIAGLEWALSQYRARERSTQI